MKILTYTRGTDTDLSEMQHTCRRKQKAYEHATDCHLLVVVYGDGRKYNS